MLKIIKALFVAIKAHKGQKDKGGKPYIFHPIRVSLNAQDYDAKVVALLHDLIEDTDYKIEDLDFLNENQKEALLLLTHDEDASYLDYVIDIKKNKIARCVKLADLEQNMNLKRLKRVTEKDLRRVEKYKKAKSILLEEE
ncbi:GTP pyrophosphokinase [Peptoniphilus sp. MSJ-1]|uniref:GTP pyrophosphokinase n=1 Tax=Peptoniphilus ovalis TaxID=2841503 RepID=A0ABS6FGF5_9FIRM|nr:GTP pyrophosphokinase [Peptoniphilus ovalis]MBU5668612.1 GTP pyrophosphokinase [Peptoniphilus ovalis]